jgi:hypothetical protein
MKVSSADENMYPRHGPLTETATGLLNQLRRGMCQENHIRNLERR